MVLQYSLAVLLLCCSSSYALIGFGACPTKAGVNNFDLNRFSGFWYENRALENIHLTQEAWGSCLSVLFDGTTIKDVTVDENPFSDFLPGGNRNAHNFTRLTTTLSTLVFGRNHTGQINADFVSNSSEFKIHGTWRFVSIPVQTIRVLETDYTNWALLWSCQDLVGINRQNAWILTRTRTLTPAVSSTIINSLFAQGLPENELRVTEQTNCQARANRNPFFSPLVFAQVKTAHDKI